MKDFLKKLGIDEQLADQIAAEVDKRVSDAQSWTNADKSALEKKIERLEEQNAEADKTIQKLESANNENKTLLGTINDYKKKIDELKEQSDKDRIDYAIDLALERAGAINPKTVRPLLDMSKIAIGKDGNIAGVDEQVSAIMNNETNAFLFKSDEPESVAEPEPVPEVKRGGYEPLAADSQASTNATQEKPTATSYGAMAAEYVSSQRDARTQKVNDFWSGN